MFRFLATLFTLSWAAAAAAPPALAQEARIFTDARLLTMDDVSRVIERGWLRVENGRIAAMGAGDPTDADAAGAIAVPAAGATLMPGLHDMHVHYWKADQGLSYLLNGITSVRNLTGSTADFALNQAAVDGAILAPRVWGSGPLMDGDPPVRDSISLVVTSPEQAVGAVRAQSLAYFRAIKLYEMLDADTFRAAVAEAKRLGMAVYAHTPQSLTVGDLLDLGITSLEHLDGFAEAMADPARVGTRNWSVAQWAAADRTLFAGWAAHMKASGVTGVPTMALFDGWRAARDEREDWFDREELAIFGPNDVNWWRGSIAEGGYVARTFEDLDAAIANKTAFLSALREAGVPLLIGTDPPNPFVLSGYAIHDELRAFVAAGYSPTEVLRIATRDAARFGGREDLGIVREGARADLILVANDPRVDLDTLRRPLGVMVAGHWRDRAALDAAFAERAARIAGSSD